MPYTAEVLPADDIIALFQTNWDVNASLPLPTFIDINDGTRGRHSLRSSDLVLVKVDSPSLEETPIGNWVYVNRTTRMLLEIWTETSRQRLWDIAGELRRIAHLFRHTMTNYQRIQWNRFEELIDTEMNAWAGRATVTLENNGVLAETT